MCIRDRSNPAFSVDSFTGYCDPVAVFGDIDPIGDITLSLIHICTNSGMSNAGYGYEFKVITCVVLGGVSVTGGYGKIDVYKRQIHDGS